jgi:hypothetical protein
LKCFRATLNAIGGWGMGGTTFKIIHVIFIAFDIFC